ncbi:MAG: beta-ketoacyl-[acyl-carrier-protein] synthase family protein [Verrucomicrobia bacterium]|jgi:3-oxoacyl-[acyl-carrier-protein] synthase II|nr:MAG: beta-ketoacyl-[acyl-carrier-protein] synthase family protein [Verrucomicrobiota bacterium]PYJ94253.1 MAG: beta-ketoacyl-[acyl-carrier-protein] synthase family protein [Verrucomicrobiota bacterium]PYK33524.1 MAG: beta-ketoacyl-[acyl-carrier-protein] synthase family protein [Verrucomicrobiota bacterium]PYL81612.1 MAG: beta-ketoacyl-[acyl-carrier-protein] synthase family protein [Verrucomicrobiota bacterium]
MTQSGDANGKKRAARVAVVAAGVVSPLGFGLSETLDALRKARDCVTPVTRFSVTQCRCKTAGQVPDDRLLNKKRDTRAQRLHRASHMMIEALGEALAYEPQLKPELLVIGTTSGGMSYGEDYYRSLHRHRSLRHAPAWIANYPAQKPLIDAQEAFGISAPCQVIANACASGTNAIGHAFECVRSGRYQRVLTGGYDALSELVFVGFDSLQASTPEKCRPFDRHRTGMVLGEGAAILALENLDSAHARGARILAEITGYGVSTDNFHLTQPDPSGVGPRRAMERAIESTGTEALRLDYINAHGTATELNDAAEGKAISELFDGVPVSSTKSMMGHSLGAAGAVEAVVCLLALRHQFLPANINFRAPDEALDLNIVGNEARPAPLRTVMSNSFGFGGTNASIVMHKFET